MNCKECKNKNIKEMIQKDHFDCVKYYLNLSDRKIDGELLIEAAKYNNIKILKMLIENKADVNAVNEHNDNALITSVKGNLIENVKILLDNKVNINHFGKNKSSAISEAARCGNDKILELLMYNEPSTINKFNNYNYTPLCEAISENYPKCIKLLLENGADVNYVISDKNVNSYDNGFSICMLACHFGRDECLKEIIDTTIMVNECRKEIFGLDEQKINFSEGKMHFSGRKVNLNYTDKYNNTALMIAAMKNNTNCCKLLIDAKADVNLKNVYGSNAKSLARSDECKSIFEEKKKEIEEVKEKEKVGSSCIIL